MFAPIDATATQFAGLQRVLNHPEHRAAIGEHVLQISAIEERTPQLTRVSATIAGDHPLTDWDAPNPTVRIAIPEPPEELAGLPGAPTTTSRIYTVADLDLSTRTIHIDLVRHDHPSPAMRWLDSLAVADTVQVTGPRHHRVPCPGTPRVLLADASALPAATRILQTMPDPGESLLIAAVPADQFALTEQQLASVEATTTLRRIDPAQEFPLARAFEQLRLRETVTVWAGGEREDMRGIRQRCKNDLALPPERTQVFGYWKAGTSSTRIDHARLRSAQQLLADDGDLEALDDFEIEL